ncbi:MAG: RIP metalloprotease RseP, partial [Gammaproteobacteria bacterium]|nr:RIP metalloprotease RseP [Gammaproteobacteria bacterium]
LPLGGYVKMLDERDCEISPQDQGRAFNHKPVSARLAVLAAGPLFNFLFAILIYWVSFMMGVTEVRPVVGAVVADSIADKAGLRAGDEIIAVDGNVTRSWQEATLAIIDDLVDDGQINVSLRENTGSERVIKLDAVAEKQALTEPGKLFEGLGIRRMPETVPAKVGRIVAGGAAEKAGLQVDDLIVGMGGQSIETWADVYEFVRARPGESSVLRVLRNDQPRELPIVIGEGVDQGQAIGLIGVAVADPRIEFQTRLRYGPIDAMVKAVDFTGEMTVFSVRMLWRMVTGDFSVKNLSGPITIAEYAGATAQMGFDVFIKFLAIVSISLGILNLLPVPILDGGQMVFQLAEAVKGSPLSPATELRGQQFGIFLLLMLMSLAFYNDILRLAG